MKQRRLPDATPRKFKAKDDLMSSTNSLPTISLITRRSRTRLQTRQAYEDSTRIFVPHSPTFMRRFTGNLPTVTELQRTRRTTALMKGLFLCVAPTHRKVHFETVDVMRVQNGR